MLHHRELSERAEARIGEVIADKWTLVGLLGVGGTAAVYEARHRNQKRVAVKILHRELSAEPAIRERFLREGYVANTVDHPGVVTIDDDDVTADGSVFLVMELLEGETLDAKLAHSIGPLEAADVLPVLDQLLDTLSEAHFKGIVHRDIKPENIFITRERQVKVLDFGIARLLEMSASSRKVTQVGTMMGTPAFMAPEQARALWDEVDARTDLWAVGATAFNLLTREFVHEGRTVNEALALAMMKQADSVASRNPDLPPELVDVVDRALAFHKIDRWQSALEMQDAVRQAAAALGIDLAPPLAPHPMPSRPSAAAAQGHLELDAPLPLMRTLSRPSAAVERDVGAPRVSLQAAPAAISPVAGRDPVLETANAMASAVEPRRVRARWPIAVAVLGLALAGVGAFALTRSGDGSAGAGSAAATSRPETTASLPVARSSASTATTSVVLASESASSSGAASASPAPGASSASSPRESASSPVLPQPTPTFVQPPPPETTYEPPPPPLTGGHIDTTDLPGHVPTATAPTGPVPPVDTGDLP